MTESVTPAPVRGPSLIIQVGSSFEAQGVALTLAASALPGGSAVYPTANKAIYCPITLQSPCVIDKVFVSNGTVVSGNFDIGIYDSAATPNRLFSTGSTAQAGTSVLQEVDVTGWSLSEGNFYLAFACDNTTATFYRSPPSAAALETLGYASQVSAFVLPSTATFATPSLTYFPVFGISTRSLTA